jgi:hypothetical protein
MELFHRSAATLWVLPILAIAIIIEAMGYDFQAAGMDAGAG